jgi:rubrerythrin
MVTLVGTETDFVEMLGNLVQLDLDAMEAYDAAMARVGKDEYRQQLEAFKGDHLRHAEELSKIVTELGGKASTGPGTKQNVATGGVILADMVGDKRILEALKENEDDTTRPTSARWR